MRTPTASFVTACSVCSLMASTTPAHAQIVVQLPVPVYGQGYVVPVYQQPQPVYAPAPRPGPKVIKDWEEGEATPPGYHRSERTRLGPVIGGAALFGVMYLVTVLGVGICATPQVACGGSTGHEDALLIPAVGPFIQMGQTSNPTGNTMLVIDGLAQLGGIALFTYGVAVPKTVLVRDDIGSLPTPRLSVFPMLGAGRGGAGLVASF
jgi:hypothetical protein